MPIRKASPVVTVVPTERHGRREQISLLPVTPGAFGTPRGSEGVGVLNPEGELCLAKATNSGVRAAVRTLPSHFASSHIADIHEHRNVVCRGLGSEVVPRRSHRPEGAATHSGAR